MNGTYLINKPVGITSHDVIDRLRRVTGERRIGHAGTLDPLASGLLVVAIGREFTRQLDSYKDLYKEYVATVRLGEVSSTYDAEGEIKSISDDRPAEQDVKSALNKFLGKGEQLPPQFSAKKVGGVRAYELARSGSRADLSPQKIDIKDIELLRYDYPEVEFRVEVSPGTFIRSMANDLGDQLQVGAYLASLVRTKVGDYKLSEAIELDKISSPKDLKGAKIS